MKSDCTDVCRRDMNDGKCISHKARELATLVDENVDYNVDGWIPMLDLAKEILEITEDF